MKASRGEMGRSRILHQAGRCESLGEVARVTLREDGCIHEVKLTDKMEEAHEMQLLYYLYYLKLKGVEGLRGQIDYPKLRQTKSIELTPDSERHLEQALEEMKHIVALPRAPQVEWMKICRSCSYAELCWG